MRKPLLYGLMGLALTLGAGCSREANSPSQREYVLESKKINEPVMAGSLKGLIYSACVDERDSSRTYFSLGTSFDSSRDLQLTGYVSKDGLVQRLVNEGDGVDSIKDKDILDLIFGKK
ncbi:MAG: hypothetical protein ACP5NS_03765 [Candidatus Pacearchaeota archaeon]